MVKNGTVEAGPEDEHPAEVADLAGLLGLGSDHEARACRTGTGPDVVGVAQLENRAALSAPSASMAPPRWRRVVGHHADRPALDRGPVP